MWRQLDTEQASGNACRQTTADTVTFVRARAWMPCVARWRWRRTASHRPLGGGLHIAWGCSKDLVCCRAQPHGAECTATCNGIQSLGTCKHKVQSGR